MTSFHLGDLAEHAPHFSILLGKETLDRIFQRVSSSSQPWRNEALIEFLGFTFNSSVKGFPGLYAIVRGNKTMRLGVLSKLVELSGMHWSEIETGVLFLRAGQQGGEISPSFPLRPDFSLGLVIGHLLGDGSIDKRYQQPFFTNSENALIFEFMDAMRNIFGCEPRIWLQDADYYNGSKWNRRIQITEIAPGHQIGLFYPKACGLILNILGDDFALGRKKRITPRMMTAPDDFIRGLIRAFFDDEGHVDPLRGIRFHNDNKQVMESIKLLLSRLGIESSPLHAHIRRGIPRYYFNICAQDALRRYMKIIGMTSPKKRVVMENRLGRVRPYKRDCEL